MRNISAMYKWSGGTDYKHTCIECSNCIRMKRGSKYISRCRAYGEDDKPDTNWNENSISCRFFGKPYNDIPISLKMQGQKRHVEISADTLQGQISFADFPGVIP